MSITAPIIDNRKRDEVLAELRRRLPGYVANWDPIKDGPAAALMQIFARYQEVLNAGANQLPNRNLLAFLDMLGISLLPAQSARAPLVFRLAPDSSDVTLPAATQVAAQIQPAPPSAIKLPASAQAASQPPVFATAQTVTLVRGKLAAVHSTQPGNDESADHSALLTDGLAFFNDMQLMEHAIYLGHERLFALAGDITVLLSFTLKHPAARALNTAWEYLAESGWIPLEKVPEDDTTLGFRVDGQIALRRACGPDARKETFHGHTSYWLRGKLTSRLLPSGSGGQRTVPVINDVRASVKFTKKGVPPDAAFADTATLDTSKDFYPFGQQPARYSTFYLASKEVFQRKRAHVQLQIELSTPGKLPASTTTQSSEAGTAAVADPVPIELSWEYFDDRSWVKLDIEPDPESTSAFEFTSDAASVSFSAPSTWAETDVNGLKNYWLRVRIVKGDFGRPVSIDIPQSGDPKLLKSTLNAPIVEKISLGYSYITEPTPVDHGLAKNEFVFEDISEACRWPDRTFEPFKPAVDRQPTIHFGFDRPLPVGLISLYAEASLETPIAAQGSPFIWEYLSPRGWTELGVLDETLGFRQSGMIQFIGPRDAVAAPGLGGQLYRIRARLKQGERAVPIPMSGCWLNAVWANHQVAFERELLGASDGNPGQGFVFRYAPVLRDEVIEVQEWLGRGESWTSVIRDVPETDVRYDSDPATNDITGVWVRWYSREHSYDSTPTDRHYVIERSAGLIRFGDGVTGMVPPAGSSIIASYSTGGGASGNVPAGSIAELRTALPLIAEAFNPVAASGGADTELAGVVSERGPQWIRHRSRAISASDFEWLAREASPEVSRVRCLSITSPDGHALRGWVTLIVVPHSLESRPFPSAELCRRLRQHLAGRVPATLANHIQVLPPMYVPVSVQAEIVPRRAAEAAEVEARVRENLNRFLHPLTGVALGSGWDFGQVLHFSQIAAVIEHTAGVDYVSRIKLKQGDRIFDQFVPVAADGLVCAGDHELMLTVGKG